MRYTSETIAKACGKKVKEVLNFPSNGTTFSAYNEASDTAERLGFVHGSMCRDNPIALAVGADYIAKWDNIPHDEYSKIEGVLLSEDFRDGSVKLVIFE